LKELGKTALVFWWEDMLQAWCPLSPFVWLVAEHLTEWYVHLEVNKQILIVSMARIPLFNHCVLAICYYLCNWNNKI